VRHGTISMHNNESCRCQPCCEAWATYCRQWRKARRERGVCRYCDRRRGENSLCPEHDAKAKAANKAYYRTVVKPLMEASR
jgi:hypothetical protein